MRTISKGVLMTPLLSCVSSRHTDETDPNSDESNWNETIEQLINGDEIRKAVQRCRQIAADGYTDIQNDRYVDALLPDVISIWRAIKTYQAKYGQVSPKNDMIRIRHLNPSHRKFPQVYEWVEDIEEWRIPEKFIRG